MIVFLRSCLYWLVLVIATPILTLLSYLILPLPPVLRYRIMTSWGALMLFSLRVFCGLRFRVRGADNIPAGPAMVMCKHQSAWETIALQHIFPPQVWVLKREVLRLPFFGWAIATLSPIAIDRGNRTQAQKYLMEAGRDRLDKGFWIVIFPEGTRVPPGQRGRYNTGGARLAADLNIPIIPVALNSGEFWPRNSFSKWPGMIDVVVGNPIETSGRKGQEIMREVEGWIEEQMTQIQGQGPRFFPPQDHD